jgi:hypothetical protein
VSKRRLDILIGLLAAALVATVGLDRAAARLQEPVAERPRLPLAPIHGPVTLLRPSFDRPVEIMTLGPAPTKPDGVDTLLLAPRPSIVIAGEGLWDDGPLVLRRAFAELFDAAADHGLAVTGHPLAVFRETDDRGYRFEAMLPVVAGSVLDHPVVSLGESPAGYVLRFVHSGPFEEIDLTYDAIASYLESEGLEPQDLFIEEFVELRPDAPDDTGVTVFIYVFPQ